GCRTWRKVAAPARTAQVRPREYAAGDCPAAHSWGDLEAISGGSSDPAWRTASVTVLHVVDLVVDPVLGLLDLVLDLARCAVGRTFALHVVVVGQRASGFLHASLGF